MREGFYLVGVAGFEPTASSSRTKRATKLRHTPRPHTRTGNIRLSAVLARTYFSPTLSQNAKRLLNGLWGQAAVSAAPLQTTNCTPTNYELRIPLHNLNQGRGRAAEQAHRGVRGSAEAIRNVQPRLLGPARQPRGPRAVDTAVGHNGLPSGQAHLATVGMTRKHQVVAIFRKSIQHVGLRRVRQADSDVGIRVRGTGDLRIILQLVMRVIHTGQHHLHATRHKLQPGMGGILPTVLDKRSAHAAPRQLYARGLALLARQVLQRVDRPRREVVIRAEHEGTRTVQQGAERCEDTGNGLVAAQVVASINHQVRVQSIEAGNPLLLQLLVGEHVEVGDMQNLERLTLALSRPGERSGCQHGNLHTVEFKCAQFDLVRVDERRQAKRGESCGRPQNSVGKSARCHDRDTINYSGNLGRMSELKNTIVSDMTAAMKARDKETVAALRMLKAAIQTEEVSGSKHELTDDEVLRVIEREVKKRRESAEMYAENGRQELADAELAEAEVFARYQPEQLDDDAVKNLVAESVAEVAGDGTPSMKIMGQVMKVAKEKAAGQVDGKRLSEAVKAALQG